MSVAFANFTDNYPNTSGGPGTCTVGSVVTGDTIGMFAGNDSTSTQRTATVSGGSPSISCTMTARAFQTGPNAGSGSVTMLSGLVTAGTGSATVTPAGGTFGFGVAWRVTGNNAAAPDITGQIGGGGTFAVNNSNTLTKSISPTTPGGYAVIVGNNNSGFGAPTWSDSVSTQTTAGSGFTYFAGTKAGKSSGAFTAGATVSAGTTAANWMLGAFWYEPAASSTFVPLVGHIAAAGMPLAGMGGGLAA